MCTYYFDLDTVLVEPRDATQHRKGSYFKDVVPNPEGIELFKYFRTLNNVSTVVCTRVQSKGAAAQQIKQAKLDWCIDNLGIGKSQFLCTPATRTLDSIVMSVPSCQRGDKLFLSSDVYTLLGWVYRGGQGIQFIREGRDRLPDPD